MCGKFTQMFTWAEIVDFSRLIDSKDGDEGGGGDDGGDGGRETVTPMRFAHVIRLNEAGERETVRMRWGFVDKRNPSGPPRPMHARGETIDRLPIFSAAFAYRRGIVAVKTFNVGEEVGKKTIQHVLTPRDGKPLGLAVIWEPARVGDAELLTFVMVTVSANKLIEPVTDRMPAVIPPDQWGTWLGENGATPEDAKALCVPYQGDLNMALEAKPAPRPRGGREQPSPLL